MSELPKFVASRLQNSQPVGAHPDANVLAAFAEQSLSERERASVLLHLATCADCREVAALAMQPERVETLEPAEVAPRSWFRWPSLNSPTLRWGAAAACAVIVSAAVLMRTHNAKTTLTPYVSSDKVSLESDRAVVSSPPAPVPALTDHSTTDYSNSEDNERRYRPQRTPSSMASGTKSELADEKRNLNKPVSRGMDTGLPANGRDAGAGVAYDFAKAQPSETQRLREKVEESAVAQGLAKEGNLAAQEKSLPSTPAPSVEGKDQTGVRVADKLSRQEQGSSTPVPKASAQKSAADAPAAAPKRDDSPIRAIGATSETVEVTGAAVQVLPNDLTSNQLQSLKRAAIPVWNVTADGDVLRSFDAGKNWKTIPIDSKARFVAMSTTGASIWVGGKGGVLYHSIDVGEHWTRVTPRDGETTLTSDIAGIEFNDLDHGAIRAGQNELWSTSDGGKTWKRQ